MNKLKKYLFLTATLLLASGCTPQPQDVTDAKTAAVIYPDYTDITIPANIAPLNFLLRDEVEALHVSVEGKAETLTVQSDDHRACFPTDDWKALLQKHLGDTLTVTVTALKDEQWLRYPTFYWYVAPEKVDAYLSYRLIEPAYEVWNEVEIHERCVENFDEKVISTYKNTDNSCMNCHIYGNKSGALSMFHLRGSRGGTILNRNGELRKLALKNEKTISATVYGDFHPSGRYGVFSTNIIIPAFHSTDNQRLEVYDTASDLVIADFDNNRLIHSPLMERKDKFETFPTFSPDGKSVYFCVADSVALPEDIRELKYSLCRIGFDAETQQWGTKIDTLWNAQEMNGSVCHPKVSPDGRYLLYTVADYGTFPIWHKETELQLMDLETGVIDSLAAVRSNRSDTYHSWSSNSRWFVFASKRGDGQYGKPYFCYFDASGKAHKPFVLPQEYPDHYDYMLKSYNIPDLSATPLPFDEEDVERIYQDLEAETFK